MAHCLVLLSAFFFSFATPSDAPIDKIGVKGPLEFHKTRFNLAWTDKPKDTYYIQEYVPEGEKVEHFNQMLTIHLFLTEISVEDAVGQKAAELDERKKTDATCQYQVTTSPDGSEAMVDCILGETNAKGDKMKDMEFNVYRYKRIDIGNGKHAILVYAYSKDAYGDDITNFLNTLKDDRIELMNAMIGTDMPTITLDMK
jgi:hypothetical protein